MAPQLLNGTGLYIGGEWRTQSPPGKALDVYNPATGHLVASVVAADSKDVEDAVAAAAGAFGEWSVLAPDQRGSYLQSAHEGVVARSRELARILTLEQGKPIDRSPALLARFGATEPCPGPNLSGQNGGR